jgi:hypothetical protein
LVRWQSLLVAVLALQRVLVRALVLLRLCCLLQVQEPQGLWCWLQEFLQ